jgi:hydrogenase maturation protease
VTEARVVVIGYGSDLRGDDVAGRVVAAAVEERAPDDVRVVQAHQLTPELAAEVVGAERVIFVDAAVGSGEVEVREVTADPAAPVLTHHVGPAGVVALAGHLGTAPGAAWTVRVPAADLSIGTELSPVTQGHVRTAVARVLDLCEA